MLVPSMDQWREGSDNSFDLTAPIVIIDGIAKLTRESPSNLYCKRLGFEGGLGIVR